VADSDRTASTIRGEAPTQAPNLELRMGEVKAIDFARGRLDITLGGGDEIIPGVRHLSNYRAIEDDPVWCLVNGPDLLVIDRTSAYGPSAIADATSALINDQQSTTSASFVNLPTLGPQLTTAVSPSGNMIVSVGAWISATAGGAMSVLLEHFDGVFKVQPSLDFAQTVQGAGSGRWFGASRVIFYTGLKPGKYTVTCKYATVGGGTATFNRRIVAVVPL
jgi:hypothetical protein